MGLYNMLKKCNKCLVEKSFDSFGKDVRGKYGIYGRCKDCKKEDQKIYNKTYYEKYGLDRINKMSTIRNNIYRQQDPERYKLYAQKNYQTHKEIRIKNAVNYERKRTKEDPVYKLSKRIRTRLRNALKNNTKNGSAVRDLGCSLDYFKEYIESKFQLGMSWENHGKWHLDHIVPLIVFDLTERSQALKACHYTNYQPLWASDNLIKSAKDKKLKAQINV